MLAHRQSIKALLVGGLSAPLTMFSLLCILAASASAQTGPPLFQYVTATPSGPCTVGVPIQIVFSTGFSYSCNSGTWGDFGGNGGGGGGGGVSIVSSGNLTPLFSVTVNNPTTSPAFAFTAPSQSANTIYGNLTGSSAAPNFYAVPTWNQSTTGNAATATALAAAPTRCSSGNAPTGVDVSGNSLGCQAIAGGGGGATLETNGVANFSQTLLNPTDTSSIAFTNPSGGLLNAALKAPAASSLVYFNGSSTYGGLTLGTGLSIVGGALTSTATGGNVTSGTLTANDIMVATGASAIGNSLLTDNGTALAYGGTGGFNAGAGPLSGTGTTPTAMEFSPGTGTVPVFDTGTQGFVAAISGGTAYRYKFAPTANAGFLFTATPASGDGITESQLSSISPTATISGNVGTYGTYGINTYLGGTKMPLAGHFTNLRITNTSSSSCTTAPAINVQDVTASTAGTPVTGSTTGTAAGTSVDGTQTLTFAAGDSVNIFISSAGGTCSSSFFTIDAQYATP